MARKPSIAAAHNFVRSLGDNESHMEQMEVELDGPSLSGLHERVLREIKTPVELRFILQMEEQSLSK